MCDDKKESISDNFVKCLRKFASISLNKEKDLYEHMIIDENFETFNSKVLKMGEEAEQVAIVALTKMLNVHILMYQVDRVSPIPKYTLPDDTQNPKMFLLFRPGHYDIFYGKD